MYTSVVGKTFLKEYNRRNETEYSAKEFFDKVLFEVHFNHDKFMYYMNNSPFDQLVKQKKNSNPKSRKGALQTLHESISQGEYDGSIAVGYPASTQKKFHTTSGMVSNISIPNDEDEAYFSWIGGSLSIGINDGYSILFNDPEITYATFEGWQYYRRLLNSPVFEKLPQYKLTSWNGQWLTYRYDEYYDADFNPNTLIGESTDHLIRPSEKGLEISPISWSKLFFSLSRATTETSLIANIFSFVKTNKTVGFIPFHFQSGRNLVATYQKLFGEDEYRLKHSREFENWFGRDIRTACQMGSIGLHALRPESLKNYFGDSKNLKFYSPKTERKKGESEEDFRERMEKETAKSKAIIISYQTYKTWLVAMLSKNKTDISDYSRDIAQALVRYRAGGRRTDRKNLLENEFFQTNKIKMLEALNKITTDEKVEDEVKEKMNSLRDQVHFLSKEDFSYFITLLKFDYSYAEFKNPKP